MEYGNNGCCICLLRTVSSNSDGYSFSSMGYPRSGPWKTALEFGFHHSLCLLHYDSLLAQTSHPMHNEHCHRGGVGIVRAISRFQRCKIAYTHLCIYKCANVNISLFCLMICFLGGAVGADQNFLASVAAEPAQYRKNAASVPHCKLTVFVQTGIFAFG